MGRMPPCHDTRLVGAGAALALALSCAAPVVADAAPLEETTTMMLLDFEDPSSVDGWRPVHDGVMGGRSRGAVAARDGGAVFTGDVSLDNGGGFASFRLSAALPDLSTWDGLRLRIRGDGRVCKLALRTDGAWDGVSWQASFRTAAGDWRDVEVAFEDLVPTWRGRLVTGADRFDASMIRQVGLVIADEQVGAFELGIRSVEAWRAADDGAPGTRSAHAARSASIDAALDAGADADALRALMRWEERLLVVAAPRDLDTPTSQQSARFVTAGAALAARELRVVHLVGERGGRIAGRALSAASVVALRERWDIPAGWSISLVGKDGGVKERWNDLVTTDQVFALVDGMPMRRREIAER